MSTPAIEAARPARSWGVVVSLCILAAAALWFIQQAALLQLRKTRRGALH
jgi:hypothetical protein